jgi:hypothetical protein
VHLYFLIPYRSNSANCIDIKLINSAAAAAVAASDYASITWRCRCAFSSIGVSSSMQ